MLTLGIGVLLSVATNPRFQWDIVAQYFFSPQVLRGLANTVLLTVVSMAIAIALGILLALMRMSRSRVLRWFSAGYIWLFRGTPLLVQLILFVTHEMGFARDVADRIVFMDGGEIIEQGPPQAVLQNPRHARTAGFVASIR